MRLLRRSLDNNSIELTEFNDDNIPRYAILSHTWGDQEVKYDELLAETGLKKSGSLSDLQNVVLRVPVCEWSVHTWTQLYERQDAEWVSANEVRPFAMDKHVGMKLWTG